MRLIPNPSGIYIMYPPQWKFSCTWSAPQSGFRPEISTPTKFFISGWQGCTPTTFMVRQMHPGDQWHRGAPRLNIKPRPGQWGRVFYCVNNCTRSTVLRLEMSRGELGILYSVAYDCCFLLMLNVDVSSNYSSRGSYETRRKTCYPYVCLFVRRICFSSSTERAFDLRLFENTS